MSRHFLFISLLVLASLSFQASSDSGTATFYTEYTPSACFGDKDDGVMIAAASEDLWEDGRACGDVYKVKCVGATNEGDPHPCRGGAVTVKIVDFCPPPGCRATIDLSQESFAKIADTEAGKIKISFNRE